MLSQSDDVLAACDAAIVAFGGRDHPASALHDTPMVIVYRARR